jgi:hypothetical protein
MRTNSEHNSFCARAANCYDESMYLTNHAMVGALIGLSVDDVALAAPLALASHFAMDMLPHGGEENANFHQPKWRTIGVLDCCGALAVYLLALSTHPYRFVHITVGTFFACLPDLTFIPRIFWGFRRPSWFHNFHGRIQWSQTFPGNITELVVAGLAAWRLFG